MARFTVGGETTDYELNVKKGHVVEHDGEEDGFFGKLSTIKCCVEPTEGYQIYTLRVKFNPGKNNRGARQSRGGFWAGVHDQLAKGEVGGKFFTSCEIDNETTGFQIDIEQWKWGKQPEITFRRDRNQAQCNRIWFTFASRPFFGDYLGENQTENVVLEFSLLGKKEIGGRTEVLKRINVTQQHSDIDGEGDDEKLENLHDYGAFNLEGMGNSVHPKQLYTCRALRRTILTDFSEKNEISIGYIGPDTTENLRSVIRILAEDDELKERDYNLHVLYEKDWDIPTAIDNFEGSNLELTNSPLELNDVYISDFLSGSEDLSIDILLATYVGPWAVFTSKKSKNNYRKLLKKIVKEEPYSSPLIQVMQKIQ